MNCLICNKKEAVKFQDDYKLEIKEDKDYFKNAKIYRCNDCNFSFVYPMPTNKTLDHFYKYVYILFSMFSACSAFFSTSSSSIFFSIVAQAVDLTISYF